MKKQKGIRFKSGEDVAGNKFMMVLNMELHPILLHLCRLKKRVDVIEKEYKKENTKLVNSNIKLLKALGKLKKILDNKTKIIKQNAKKITISNS